MDDQNVSSKPGVVTLAGDDSGGVTPTIDASGAVENSANSMPESPTISSGNDSIPALDNADLADLIDDHAEAMAGFNPDVHAIGADGKPIIKPDGSFAKKRGRKPGGKNSVSAHAPRALPPKIAPGTGVPLPDGDLSPSVASSGDEKISAEATAKMCTNLTFAVGTMVFGQDLAKPSGKDEINSIKNAYKDYFDSRGTPDLPPEIGLLFAIGAYAAPRLQHETMREKVARWGAAVKGWLFRTSPKLEKPQAENSPEDIPPSPSNRSRVSWGA